MFFTPSHDRNAREMNENNINQEEGGKRVVIESLWVMS